MYFTDRLHLLNPFFLLQLLACPDFESIPFQHQLGILNLNGSHLPYAPGQLGDVRGQMLPRQRSPRAH